MKRFGLGGIEIENALAILATFERILTLKNDKGLRLKSHMATRARAPRGRNDGNTRAFTADKAISRQDLRLDFARDFIGLRLEFRNATLDGRRRRFDFLLILLNHGAEILALLFLREMLLLGLGNRRLILFNLDFCRRDDLLEVLDFAFERRIVAGIRHGIEFRVGVFVVLLRFFEFATFVLQASAIVLQFLGQFIECLLKILERVQIGFHFFTAFFDIETKGFLRKIDLLKFNQLLKLLFQSNFSGKNEKWLVPTKETSQSLN